MAETTRPEETLPATSIPLELVEAAARGDSVAWSELDLRLRSRMRALLAGRIPDDLRSRLDVDDVVQHGFLAAAGRMRDFEARGAESFERWITEIMLNELRDSVRFHGRQRRSFLRQEDVASEILSRAQLDCDTPSALVAGAEGERQLARKLEALPEDEREMLRLRFVEGLTWEDIGLRVGLSECTARRRGIDALERMLGGTA